MGPQIRRPVVIGLLLIVAFFWGYRRDEVITDLTGLWHSDQTPPGPQPAGDPASAAAPLTGSPYQTGPSAGGNPPGPNNLAPPPQAGAPGFPGRPAGSAANPPGGPFPVGSPQPGAHPQPAAPNIKQTLESITPGSPQENQIAQRNLYFEKLSQQLKDLQGEQPPPVPADNNSGGLKPGTPQPENLIPSNPPAGGQTNQVGAVLPNNENVVTDNPYSHMPADSRLLPPNDSGQENAGPNDDSFPIVDPDGIDPEGDDTAEPMEDE